jgi:hypothetical protein
MSEAALSLCGNLLLSLAFLLLCVLGRVRHNDNNGNIDIPFTDTLTSSLGQ